MKKYSIGMDFGTLSARAVLVDISNGQVMPYESVFVYPHAVMTELLGKELPKDYALQHPEDYTKALDHLLPDLIKNNNIDPTLVVGIGIDFTSCTALPVDENYEPLCKDTRFIERAHAYAKLWKHHGAEKYLDVINRAVEKYGGDMLKCSGNVMSSEFMIPKLYEIYAEDREIYDSAALFMNAGDYVASVLAGGAPVHSTSYATIKEHFDGEKYPDRSFFKALGDGFADVIEEKLGSRLDKVGECACRLSSEWANKTGLREGIAIATPLVDAQSSLAAMGLEPYRVMLVMGTSAVMAVSAESGKNVDGILSRGAGSAVDGLTTFEAGIAAMGDLFEWFVKNCVPSSYEKNAERLGMNIHGYLRSLIENKKVGESGLIALDWWNGNRCVIQSNKLSGMIVGLRLSTKPEDVYRALIESTAYGLRRVLENYEEQGISAQSMVVTGGIAHKDPMLMQIFADVFARPIGVLASKQSAALGAAIYGAAAAGEYENVSAASEKMRCGISKEYLPHPDNSAAYDKIYQRYLKLYNGFGNSDIMDFLFDIRG